MNDDKKRRVNKAAVAGLGAAAFLAGRNKVIQNHGQWNISGQGKKGFVGKVAKPGMYGEAAKAALDRAKGAASGVVQNGARRVKNAAARTERKMAPKPAKKAPWDQAEGKFWNKKALSAIAGTCEARLRELGDPIDEAARKKGQTERGNIARGAVIGSQGLLTGAASGALMGRSYKKAGKVYRKRDALRDGLVTNGMSVLGGAAGYGLLRNNPIGGAKAGAIAGMLAGHTMAKAKLKRRQQAEKPQQLAAIAAHCRDLSLEANQRGEYPWQQYQRERRNGRLVEGAAVAGGVGAGALVHAGVQRAGGYAKMADRFNKVRKTSMADREAGVFGGAVDGAQAVAGKVGRGIKTAAVDGLKKARGWQTSATDALRRAMPGRRIAGLLK